VYIHRKTNSPTRAPNATMASNACTSRPSDPVKAPLLQCNFSLCNACGTSANVTEAIILKEAPEIYHCSLLLVLYKHIPANTKHRTAHDQQNAAVISTAEVVPLAITQCTTGVNTTGLIITGV